ncbi:MAG: tape measure protein [Syntrophobacteraceae bacterium]
MKDMTVAIKIAMEYAGRGVDAAVSGMNRLEGAASRVASRFSGLGVAIGAAASALAAYGATSVARDFVETAADFDRMKVALDTITKGHGEEWFDKLNKWAMSMPGNTEAAIQGFISLNARGLQPTIDQMTTIQDAASALGGSTETFNGIVKALGDIASRGKLSAEELNQLSEWGVPAKQILAEAFGKTTAEMEKFIEKGIKADAAIEILFEGLKSRFGGQSQAIMNKFAGLWEGVLSYVKEFQRITMDSGPMRELESWLRDINDQLGVLSDNGTFQQWAEQLGTSVTKAMEKLGLLGTSAETAGDKIVGFLTSAIDKGAEITSKLVPAIKDVASAIGGLLDSYNSLPDAARAAAGAGLVGLMLTGSWTFAAVAAGLAGIYAEAKKLANLGVTIDAAQAGGWTDTSQAAVQVQSSAEKLAAAREQFKAERVKAAREMKVSATWLDEPDLLFPTEWMYGNDNDYGPVKSTSPKSSTGTRKIEDALVGGSGSTKKPSTISYSDVDQTLASFGNSFQDMVDRVDQLTYDHLIQSAEDAGSAFEAEWMEVDQWADSQYRTFSEIVQKHQDAVTELEEKVAKAKIVDPAVSEALAAEKTALGEWQTTAERAYSVIYAMAESKHAALVKTQLEEVESLASLKSEYASLAGTTGDQLGAQLELLEAERARKKLNMPQEYQDQVDALYNHKELLIDLERNGSVVDGLIYGFKELGRQMETSFDQGKQLAQDMFSALSDGIGDVVSGTSTLKDAFKKVADSIVDDIASMIIKWAAFQALTAYGINVTATVSASGMSGATSGSSTTTSGGISSYAGYLNTASQLKSLTNSISGLSGTITDLGYSIYGYGGLTDTLGEWMVNNASTISTAVGVAGGLATAGYGISNLVEGNYVQGGLQTVGGGLMAAGAYTGQWYLAAIGGVLTLLSSLFGGDGETPSFTSKFGYDSSGVSFSSSYLDSDTKSALKSSFSTYFENYFNELDSALNINIRDIMAASAYSVKVDIDDDMTAEEILTATLEEYWSHYAQTIATASYQAILDANEDILSKMTTTATQAIYAYVMANMGTQSALESAVSSVYSDLSSISDILDAFDTTVRQSTMSDLEITIEEINQKYDDYAATLTAYGVILDQTNLEAARAIEIQEAMADSTSSLTEAFDAAYSAYESFIDSMLGSSLSPVSSKEAIEQRYQSLQLAAASGDEDAYEQLLDYIQNTYLPYMQDYSGGGANYDAIYRQTVALAGDLAALFGTEAGSDETTALLAEQNALLKTIAENGQTPIVIEVDGKTIGYVFADQASTNSAVIEAIRKAASGA